MIYNGTILLIDTLNAPTTGGDVSFTDGSALSVPCAIDAPTQAQQYILGQQIAGATAVIYGPSSLALPTGSGWRITARPTGGAAVTYVVIKSTFMAGGLSHWVLFVRAQ